MWASADLPPKMKLSRGVNTHMATGEATLAFLGLAPGEQLAPVVGLDLDVEPVGRGLDALPGLVALAVADPFDLVEAGHGVADTGRVGERLLARLGEGELAFGEVVVLGGAHPLVPAWRLARARWAARVLARFWRAACFCFSVAMAAPPRWSTTPWWLPARGVPEIGSGRQWCAAL